MLSKIKSHHTLIILIVAITLQLYIPINIIIEKNTLLSTGTEFNIKTRPIDPSDPFRGKYVSISPVVELQDGINFESTYYPLLFVRLSQSPDGYTVVSELSDSPNKPLEGEGVIKLKKIYILSDRTIRLPFDRYYMQEHLAPKAERIYNEGMDTYIKIKVKNQKSVLEGLYIGDSRIEELINQ